MSVRFLKTLLLSSFVVSGTALAQQDSGGSLLVLSKHDHTLAIVDPVTLKVKAKAPAGDDPHEVVASEDGRFAYISNYGFGAFHTITVVELASAQRVRIADVAPLAGPHGLAYVGGKVWFTSEVAKAVGRYDPVTGKIDMVLGTGQNRIHMLYVSSDAQHIVASNVNSGTMSLINHETAHAPAGPAAAHQPRMDWNQTVVKVGNGSEGFDLSPDGKEIWVANAQDGTISVIDPASKTVTATVQSETRGGNRLKFSKDGRYVLVSAGANVVVLDAKQRSVVKHIAVGHGSAGILMEPNGKRAFIACGPDNYVAVVDLSTLAITGHFDVGGEPDGMFWAQ